MGDPTSGDAASPRTKREVKPSEAIWEAPDRLRERIEPILREGAPPPPRENGRRQRIDWRAALDGVLFRRRSGGQWNRLPGRFGDDSSAHRRFRRRCRNGASAKIRAILVEGCDEWGAVDRKWRAADGMPGKARSGGEEDGPGPHRPGEGGHREAPPGRGRRRAVGCRHRRGRRPGLPAAR